MNWLNPWAWAGLLSLTLPVLVHLYSRRPPREMPFPSLRFLEGSRLLPTRRTRLSDMSLLVVRLLILFVAVAALAQPLWRSVTEGATSAVVRAIIIDTLAVGDRSAARLALERAGLSDVGLDEPSLRIETDTPHDVLDGATAWLQQHTGRAELIVLSDFRDDALDSVDLARLPRAIAVRLVRTAPLGDRAGGGANVAPRRRAVQWASGATPSVAEAVRSAARANGANALEDAVSVSISDTTARRIVVASPGADSLAAWTREARALHQPWMGDVALALRHDTSLVTAAWSSPVTDTTFEAPFTVLLYSATRAPLIAAAALRDANGLSRLLLYSRASADALPTATLLWSASRALDASLPRTRVSLIPSDAQLARWEHAPAAVAGKSTGAARIDRYAGPSHGRLVWIAVLLLLSLETFMRRRLSRARPTVATS